VSARTYSNVQGMTSINNWHEGTLLINILNMEAGFVIWAGKSDAIVIEKMNRVELITQGVSELLSEFPPVKK
jgi:hypothetical protein